MSTLRAKTWLISAVVLFLVGLFLGSAWLIAPSLTNDVEGAHLVEAQEVAAAASIDEGQRTLPAQRRAAFEPPLDPSTGLPLLPATLRVRVVDAATRSAVPRAQIFLLDEKSHEPLSLTWQIGPGASRTGSLVRDRGVVSSASEDGCAELPRPARRAWVGAEKDGCWGLLEVHPGIEEPIEVAIEPYREVTVEVVDERGAPVADASVNLVTPRDVFHRGSSSHTGIWEARTGVDGTAKLRYLRGELRGSRSPLELIASCAVLGHERDGVRFDVDQPPTSPLRLQRPVSGSVIVDVVDEAGQPLRQPVFVGCSFAYQQVQREGPISFGGPSLMALEGRAVFERIGLDLELQLDCWSESELIFSSVSISGPRRSSEVVHAVLRASGRFPRLTGRIVDASGAALPFLELHPLLRGSEGDCSTTGPFELDAGGRFALPITWRPEDGASLLLELVRWERNDGNEMPSGPMATCQLSHELLGTGGDVGDLVLREQPVSFAGRVVDDRGTPIKGALLRVVRVLRGENDELERHETRILELSDARGHFACRGELLGASAEIHVSAEGHGPRVFGPYAAGTLDLELALPRGGEIRGRLLLDPLVAPQELWIFARAEQVGPSVRQTQPLADGSFVLQGVAPGARDVEITWRRRLPLASVPEVAVLSAETTRDPRLQSLDLRGRLEPLELEIVEARGAALEELSLFLESSACSPIALALSLDEAHCTTVLVPRDVETLRVEARGCVPVVLASRTGRQRVELRRGPSVRLAAEAPLPRVDSGRTLLCGSLHIDEPDADDAWRAACAKLDAIELDARGAALLDLPRAGRYRIEWDSLGGHVTHFEVSDMAEVQLVRFALPWEKLETDRD